MLLGKEGKVQVVRSKVVVDGNEKNDAMKRLMCDSNVWERKGV